MVVTTLLRRALPNQFGPHHAMVMMTNKVTTAMIGWLNRRIMLTISKSEKLRNDLACERRRGIFHPRLTTKDMKLRFPFPVLQLLSGVIALTALVIAPRHAFSQAPAPQPAGADR